MVNRSESAGIREYQITTAKMNSCLRGLKIYLSFVQVPERDLRADSQSRKPRFSCGYIFSLAEQTPAVRCRRRDHHRQLQCIACHQPDSSWEVRGVADLP